MTDSHLSDVLWVSNRHLTSSIQGSASLFPLLLLGERQLSCCSFKLAKSAKDSLFKVHFLAGMKSLHYPAADNLAKWAREWAAKYTVELTGWWKAGVWVYGSGYMGLGMGLGIWVWVWVWVYGFGYMGVRPALRSTAVWDEFVQGKTLDETEHWITVRSGE